MNSYIFGIVEVRRLMLLTLLYSICGISIFVSPAFTLALTGAENEQSLKHNFGESEFYRRIQKRQQNQQPPDTDINSPATTATTTVSSDIKSSNPVAAATQATLGLEASTSTTTEKSSDQSKVNCSLESNVNKTECSHLHDSGYDNSLLKQMSDNKEMLLRTLYVTLGVTSVIVVYFVARAIWLRQKRTKSRKYRIIAQNGDQRDLEMEPLGDGKDDDDEDYTVFEVNGRKK